MKEESFIFLGKGTTLNGSVQTSQLILEGSIDGDIKATSKVLLKNGSSVFGNILTKKFLVEEGYTHKGNIKLDSAAVEKKSPEPIKEPDKGGQEDHKETDSPVLQNAEKQKYDQRLW